MVLCAVLLFVACTAFGVNAVEECSHGNTVDFKKTEPTCVTVGYTEGVYCIDCSSFVSGHEEIPFIDHLREFHEGVEATCTESGYTDGFYCSMCDKFVSGHEVIPAGHRTGLMPPKAATCTVPGYTEGVYCTVCNEILSGREVIPAAHKEVYVPEQPATCTGNGYTEGLYCTVCNEYLWGHAEIPFTDHIFTEKIIDSKHLVQQATHYSPAIYRYDCATCSAVSSTLTFTHGERLPLGATGAIKAIQNTSAIKIDWQTVPGAEGYRIYYYNGRAWQAVRDVNGTTTTFTGLHSGTVYRLAVRAFAYDNGRLVLSHDYTTVDTATQTAAPERIVSQQNNSAIRLLWTPVRNASGYRVYYKDGNSWKICVNTTVATSHTFTRLPSGKAYQFAVRPYMVLSSGVVMGDYSTFIASTTCAAPKTAVASPAPRHVSFAWGAVNGADYYQLYYKINDGGYALYRVYTAPQKLMFSGLTSSAKITFAVRPVKKLNGGYLYGSYYPVSVTVR